MAYITCEDLILGYDGRAVTKNISFEVNKGDYLCILGENGAGKSTLMKTILGLQKPMGGKISHGDGIKPYEIGYLPQQTVVQKDFPASVYEIVISGTLSKCRFRPFYSGAEKKIARENMEKMDVWELRKKCYRNLSGGQQQRVLLARALCATTNILLLDEPVSGLDPKVTAEFYQLIGQLNKSGVAIMMVSHDLYAATKYASHILHVGRRQMFFGKKEDYLQSEQYRVFEHEAEMEQAEETELSEETETFENRVKKKQGRETKKTKKGKKAAANDSSEAVQRDNTCGRQGDKKDNGGRKGEE